MLGLQVGSMVGCHCGHCLLLWLPHHRCGPGTWMVLVIKIYHGLVGLMNWDDHGCLLAVGAASWRHSAKMHRWGSLPPGCTLSLVVGNGQMLLGGLLLLWVMVGCNVATHQG